MTPITFFAQGLPKGQPRPRAFARNFGGKWQARVYNPGTAEGWKSCVAEAVKPFVSEMLMEPVAIDIIFVMPRPKAHFNSKGELKDVVPRFHSIKPDGDNLYKGTVDALKMCGLLSDDSIVVDHRVRKIYPTNRNGRTGAMISVKEPEPISSYL